MMPSLRSVFTLFFFCCFLVNKAQSFKPNAPRHFIHIIAKNDKRMRGYYNGSELKIRYHDNGQIVKAKGELFIDSNHQIKIFPYGRRPYVIINPDSIASISRWQRGGKIALAILAGADLAFGIATAIVVNNQVNFFLDPFSILFAIAFITDTYFVVMATPVVFISEWLSLRSENKGYHFYVE